MVASSPAAGIALSFAGQTSSTSPLELLNHCRAIAFIRMVFFASIYLFLVLAHRDVGWVARRLAHRDVDRVARRTYAFEAVFRVRYSAPARTRSSEKILRICSAPTVE